MGVAVEHVELPGPGPMEIAIYQKALVRLQCAPVTEAHFGLLGPTLERMRHVMRSHSGIGIAAPQVGIFLAFAIVELPAVYKPNSEEILTEAVRLVLCNPVITEREGMVGAMEGCLSVPGFRAEVKRPAKIKVKYQDENGEEHELAADGLLARAIQHETDHLSGIYFIDHLSSLKRDLIKRKLRKQFRGIPI